MGTGSTDLEEADIKMEEATSVSNIIIKNNKQNSIPQKAILDANEMQKLKHAMQPKGKPIGKIR